MDNNGFALSIAYRLDGRPVHRLSAIDTPVQAFARLAGPSVGLNRSVVHAQLCFSPPQPDTALKQLEAISTEICF
jgi:hypothetical protein